MTPTEATEELARMLKDAGVKRAVRYSTGDVAKMFGVTDQTVRVWCDQKGLRCFRPGRHRRITHHAIIRWLVLTSGEARMLAG